MTRALLLSYLWCLAWLVEVSHCFSAISPSRENNNAQGIDNFQDPLPVLNGHSRSSPSSGKMAVLLNANARGVTTDLAPIAESIFGKECVFLTNSEEEGKLAADKMVQQNVSFVIPIGGDGTLSSMINFLCDSIQSREPSLSTDEVMAKLPLVGYIPLGTGNGVGSVVGSETMSNPAWKVFGQKRRLREQVQRMLKSFHDIGQQISLNTNYLSTQQSPDVINVPMMQVSYPNSTEQQSTLCFFAGAGFDSLMLQDFQSIKKWAIRRKILTKTLSSVAGYCVALVGQFPMLVCAASVARTGPSVVGAINRLRPVTPTADTIKALKLTPMTLSHPPRPL